MNQSWPLVPLGEVLIERHETPSSTAQLKGEVRVVAKIGFSDGQIQLRDGSETKTGMIPVYPGDLLISGINVAKGAIAVYGEENVRPIAATIHYGAYIPNKERVDAKFLWWLLRSRIFRNILFSYVPGGIKTELKAKRFLPIPVPLPPLPEQRRIVAKIEELAAQINEARTLRQQSADEVEALLSASISKLALTVSGDELTMAELVGKDVLRNGKSVKSSFGDSEIRCVTLSAMRNGRIDVRNSKPVPLSRMEAKPFLLHKRDVFIVRGNGSKHFCGRAGLVSEEPESVIFPDLFIRVPVPQERMMPEFFVAIWNSPKTRQVIEDKAKTTSGIWKINQNHILTTRIPIPSLQEQQRILDKMDALQVEVDKLKQSQTETTGELDALLPSILDKAFKGEL